MSLNDKLAAMSPERRAKVEARSTDLFGAEIERLQADNRRLRAALECKRCPRCRHADLQVERAREETIKARAKVEELSAKLAETGPSPRERELAKKLARMESLYEKLGSAQSNPKVLELSRKVAEADKPIEQVRQELVALQATMWPTAQQIGALREALMDIAANPEMDRAEAAGIARRSLEAMK